MLFEQTFKRTGEIIMSEENVSVPDEEKEKYVKYAKRHITILKALMSQLEDELEEKDLETKSTAVFITNRLMQAAYNTIEEINTNQ